MNHTSVPVENFVLRDQSASVLSILVGVFGAVEMTILAAGVYVYHMYKRHTFTTTSHSLGTSDMIAAYGRITLDMVAASGRIVLLGVAYLIVGTNMVAWRRPSDGGTNNILRVLMGLVVNLVWVDYVVRRLLPMDTLRDKLIRPALATFIVLGTATVASSPGAREFAMGLMVILGNATFMGAAIYKHRRRWPRDNEFIFLLVVAYSAASLLLVGELLSPSYTNKIGNGGSMIFMLCAHTILTVGYAFAGPETKPDDDNFDIFAGLQEDARSASVGSDSNAAAPPVANSVDSIMDDDNDRSNF